jgi:beta-1,4-mannosyltransferase
MIIDWHNLAYSILALRLGDSHPLVLIAKWYEKVFSRTATAHLAVSEAMARTLKRDFLIQSSLLVLHDRPAESFQPLTPEQRLSFLARLPITSKFVNEIKNQRLRLLVSSTSWTPDEDFSLLLDALVGYSDMATSTHPQLPELMVVITGKGPQKEQYLRRIASLEDQDKLEMVTIETAWLTTDDYAKLLGSADLGVSLHMSSSGIDLPMKVVDMFGAGLPVVGWSKFEAWPELVKEGINGRGFSSIEELQNVLVNLLGDNMDELQNLRRGALEESKRGWDQEWDSVAGKLFGFTEP